MKSQINLSGPRNIYESYIIDDNAIYGHTFK